MAYKAGQKLGNYQLERFLGHGGFAEVYLGKHIYLNTHAAIKVLQRQSNNEALENFLQEARMIAGLKHPHIVGVLDFGIEEQHPFLVMAYAPYGTLRQRYSKGRIFSPATIAPHVRQVVDALHYAHEHKIIHRDVKPENMLLDDDNTMLLSDFGLAMRQRSTYHSVHSTDSAGTTIYMAPEQLRGKPCAASDQYALGIVMYEWLCGCLPFDGPDISVVVQHLHEPPVPLREHVTSLPEEVERVVLKALEKDPRQRFANVQALGAAFEEACKDIPVPEDDTVLPPRQLSTYRASESGALLPESLSGEFIGLLPDSVQEKMLPKDDATLVTSGPSQHSSSLQAPSLSASLNVNTSMHETTASPVSPTAATTTSQRRAPISRRTLLVGIAGIGILAGGIGIWRFSSSETETLPLISAQGTQRNSGTTTSSSTTTTQTATTHTNGAPATGQSSGSLPVNNNATGKNAGTATPPTHPTPSPSTSTTPAATSTVNTGGGSSGAAATATVTAPQGTTLTVQIDNPPASVINRIGADISVTTNIGNTSFQFYAVYSGLKNSNKGGQTDTINGTTDANGAGIVQWKPALPPGQVVLGSTYADVHVIATDQSRNVVSSGYVQIQIL